MKQYKNFWYLLGTSCVVLFGIFLYVGGMNYPGFNFLTQSFDDLLARDTYNLTLNLVLSILSYLFLIYGAILSYIFFKNFDTNKLLKFACVFVLAFSVYSGVCYNVFGVQQAGTTSYIHGLYSQINDQNKSVEEAQAKIDSTKSDLKENAEQSGQELDEMSEVKDVQSNLDSTKESANSKIDELNQQINEKLQDPWLVVSLSITTIGGILSLVLCVILFISSFMKKAVYSLSTIGGILGIGWISLILIPIITQNYSYIGIVKDFIYFIPFIIVAFMCAWIFIYEPKQQKS